MKIIALVSSAACAWGVSQNGAGFLVSSPKSTSLLHRTISVIFRPERHGPPAGEHGPHDGEHGPHDGEHGPHDGEHGPHDGEHGPHDREADKEAIKKIDAELAGAYKPEFMGHCEEQCPDNSEEDAMPSKDECENICRAIWTCMMDPEHQTATKGKLQGCINSELPADLQPEIVEEFAEGEAE